MPLTRHQQQLLQQAFTTISSSEEILQLLHTVYMLLSIQAEASSQGRVPLPPVASAIADMLFTSLQHLPGLRSVAMSPSQVKDASELVVSMANRLGKREQLKSAPVVAQLIAALQGACPADGSRAKALLQGLQRLRG
jgi:hypothetical protein